MSTFTIYSKDFFLSSRLRTLAKQLLGRNFGGPQTVQANLLKGLEQLGVAAQFNTPRPSGTVGVLSGPAVLGFLLKAKKQGHVTKIVAGPNMVVTPFDAQSIAQHSGIDTFIVPSEWVARWWVSLVPALKNRLRIWSAGVPDCGEKRKAGGPVIVFQKNAPAALSEFVVRELEQRGLTARLVSYGRFKPHEFSGILDGCQALVYLSRSESQGLLLAESWMANIPTLVWNPGVMQIGQWQVTDAKLSAPYLTQSCGEFFTDETVFVSRLDSFLSRSGQMQPREYAIASCSLESAAREYVNLLLN